MCLVDSVDSRAAKRNVWFSSYEYPNERLDAHGNVDDYGHDNDCGNGNRNHNGYFYWSGDPVGLQHPVFIHVRLWRGARPLSRIRSRVC